MVIGASGHGKVIADIAKAMDTWQQILFLDDNAEVKTCAGFKVVGTSQDVEKYIHDSVYVVAIGNNAIREKVQSHLEDINAQMATLVHPSAVIGSMVSLGGGTVVMAGVIVNSSTKTGRGCILNTACTIDHDNSLGDYVHVSPGVNLAGTVAVGRSSWIGTGSVVINNINICENVVVGGGSLVISDIEEKGTYIGSPIRRI